MFYLEKKHISQMVVKNGDFALSHGTKYKNNWLVVSTHLKKYARHIGSFPQIGHRGENKKIFETNT